MNTKKAIYYTTEEVRVYVKKEATKSMHIELKGMLCKSKRRIGCIYIDMSHVSPHSLRKPLLVTYESKMLLEKHLEEMLIDQFHPHLISQNNTLIPDRKVDRLKRKTLKRLDSESLDFKKATFQI